MATNTTPGFPPARRDPRQLLNTLKRTLTALDSDYSQASFFSGLPKGAFIVDTIVEVVTAFNAGTTNTLTVGTNTTSFNNIAASGDVNLASAGVYRVHRGDGRALANTADTSVFAVYTQTGTTATTGSAVILITFEGGWAS